MGDSSGDSDCDEVDGRFRPFSVGIIDHSLCSSPFLVRYRNEEVVVGDLGRFRLKGDRNDVVVVDVELLFADTTDPKRQFHARELFDVVARQCFRVRGVSEGIDLSLPFTFDEMHVCLADIIVHTALVGFVLGSEDSAATAGAVMPVAKSVAKYRRFHHRHPHSVEAKREVAELPGVSGSGCLAGCGAAKGSAAAGEQPRSPAVDEGLVEGRYVSLLQRSLDRLVTRVATLAGSMYPVPGDRRKVRMVQAMLNLERSLGIESEGLDQVRRAAEEAVRLAVERGEQARDPEASSSSSSESPPAPQSRSPSPPAPLQPPPERESVPAREGSTLPALPATTIETPRVFGSPSHHQRVRPPPPPPQSQPQQQPPPAAPPITGIAPAMVTLPAVAAKALEVYLMWYSYPLLFVGHTDALTATLQRPYWLMRSAKWAESFLRTSLPYSLLVHPGDKKAQARQAVRASTLRNVLNRPGWNVTPVENLSDYNQPVLFERVYASPVEVADVTVSSSPSPTTATTTTGAIRRMLVSGGVHLFVCVHGFQGNQYDLRLLKSYISMHNERLEDAPAHLEFLMSSTNRSNTMASIEVLGKALANEILSFIAKKGLTVARLSFLSHSMGAVISRSAIREEALAPYRDRFYLYLSLSGAHLGVTYNQNKILNGAFWVMKRANRGLSLQQLAMADARDPRDCFLYRLSSEPCFELFQHVALVGSPQDKYVPSHSATIEICGESTRDKSKGSPYITMAHNLLDRARVCQSVSRFDVYFDLTRSIDTAIGRAAHIELLENVTFFEMFVSTHPHFWA